MVFIACSHSPLLLAVADPGFSPGGAPTPKTAIIFQFFAENCMKMKEFGPPGGARVPGAPPWIRQWLVWFTRSLCVHQDNPAFSSINFRNFIWNLFPNKQPVMSNFKLHNLVFVVIKSCVMFCSDICMNKNAFQ